MLRIIIMFAILLTSWPAALLFIYKWWNSSLDEAVDTLERYVSDCID